VPLAKFVDSENLERRLVHALCTTHIRGRGSSGLVPDLPNAGAAILLPGVRLTFPRQWPSGLLLSGLRHDAVSTVPFFVRKFVSLTVRSDVTKELEGSFYSESEQIAGRHLTFRFFERPRFEYYYELSLTSAKPYCVIDLRIQYLGGGDCEFPPSLYCHIVMFHCSGWRAGIYFMFDYGGLHIRIFLLQ